MGIKQIFRDGMNESKRKSAVNKGKKGIKDKEQVLGNQMTALGQKAWESKVNIDSFGNLHELLSGAQKQEDDLKARQEDLQKQKQETEEKKKQENEKFDAQWKEVEEKKKTVDGRLNEEKNTLKAAQKEADQATSRLSNIPKEREQLNKKAVDPATPEAAKGEIQIKLDNLFKEDAEVQNKYKEKTEVIKSLNEKIAPIQEESNRLQNQIDGIKAEQKKEIGELDKILSENKKETDTGNTKLKEVDKEKRANYKQLGEKMASANVGDPAVAAEIAAIRTTEKEITDINAQVGNLESQGSAEASGAYKKMIMIIVAGVVIVIAIIVVLVIVLTPKKPTNFLSEMGVDTPKESQDTLTQLAKGLGGLKDASEKQQGKTIVVADEGTLKSALPNIGGWQMQNPSYSKGAMGEISVSHIDATYVGPGSTEVKVNISDTGTASVMLAGVKMLCSMNLTVDNENEYQKISTYNNNSVVESYNKKNQDASFAFVVKDRYLIELKTKGEKGLEILKEFITKLDLSKLQ